MWTIFIPGHEGHKVKTFELPQTSLQTEQVLAFLRGEKFLAGSNGELTEQLFAYSFTTRCTNNDEDQTPSLHQTVWVVISDGDVMPPCIIPHYLTWYDEAFIKCLEEVMSDRIKNVASWKTLRVAIRCCALPNKHANLGYEKILRSPPRYYLEG